MFPMDSAKLLCILQRNLSKLQNRNECEVINYPRLHQKGKKKKIAVNSSGNGLTIGNIQEWVPSSRKIMEDTRWSLIWAEGGHFRKSRLPLTPSCHYKDWWFHANTVQRALCKSVTNPWKKRPYLLLSHFFFKGNPEAPPLETYHWPDKCHVIILNQSLASNRTLIDWNESRPSVSKGCSWIGPASRKQHLAAGRQGSWERLKFFWEGEGAVEVKGTDVRSASGKECFSLCISFYFYLLNWSALFL